MNKPNKHITPNIQKFIDFINECEKNELQKPLEDRNICPPAVESQLVINCLCDLFLGEDWYVCLPLGQNQVNTCILDEILYKYCRDYRKLIKRRRKS